MSWGDSISAETNKRAGRYSTITGNSGSKALGKIGSRSSDSSDCLIKKAAVVLDMGEASREQGFRMNGCR